MKIVSSPAGDGGRNCCLSKKVCNYFLFADYRSSVVRESQAPFRCIMQRAPVRVKGDLPERGEVELLRSKSNREG